MINLGLIVNGNTVGFECTLPGPAEQVWFYLTQPEGLRAWLADGTVEPRLGGAIKFRFQRKEPLVRSDRAVLIRGQVGRFMPYRTLAFAWTDASREPDARGALSVPVTSEVVFELAGREHHTWLSVTHHSLLASQLTKVGTGWHAHLDQLASCMRDATACLLPNNFPVYLPRHQRQMEKLRAQTA